MDNWFLIGLGWFASSAGGSLITHFFTRQRDEAKDKKADRTKLVATCNSVCFYLAMQLSELGGLSKDIEYRSLQLQMIKKTDTLTRDITVAILQDFIFSKDLNINMEKISEVILPASGDQRGIVEILQSTFISNKKYFKIINTLERYNEAKRIMNNETTDKTIFMQNVLLFAENNMLQYQKEIEQNIRFISQSLDAFKATIKEKFNITVNLSLGEVVKLN